MSSNEQGVIFNIQRFSVHDGAGLRDLILMKGCPLRCLWCSNPESQNPKPEVAFNQGRCIGCKECGWCLSACPLSAITVAEDGKIRIDRTLCNNCGECAAVCPAQAIKFMGEYRSIDDVVKLIEEDSAFYSRSGGGITVGGGEPSVQADFVSALLEACRKRGIDTAIETCGHGRWEDMEKVCRYADLIFYDIKHMDSSKHRAFTGAGNEMILENLKRIADRFPNTPIIARTPVVPGYNDSEENIQAIADFLTGIPGIREYELLPYHGFGEPKYHQLGRKYQLSALKAPSQEHVAKLKRIAQTGCRPLQI